MSIGPTEISFMAAVLFIGAGAYMASRQGLLGVLRTILVGIAFCGFLVSGGAPVAGPICSVVAIAALAIVEAIFVAAKLVIEVLMARVKKPYVAPPPLPATAEA